MGRVTNVGRTGGSHAVESTAANSEEGAVGLVESKGTDDVQVGEQPQPPSGAAPQSGLSHANLRFHCG